MFLAKYLSENLIGKNIKSVILVAAPYKDTVLEKLLDFSLPESIQKFNEQIDKIVLIQSKDDSVVPIEHVYLFKKQLSNAEIILFENNGHFKQEHFPELVNLIKSFK
jgi:predicted alpha/beta hydrolase family esterase